MSERLEQKSTILKVIEYKYTLLIIVVSFIVLMAIIMTIYFMSGPKRKNSIMLVLSLSGNILLVFNLLLLIYNELKEYAKLKRKMITDIDLHVISELQYIYTGFMTNKDTLEDLYNEIFLAKIPPTSDNNNHPKPQVNYYESNFLFIVFGIMQNFYRNYEFNTSDTDTVHNYNSWHQLLHQIMSSPKCQQFYSTNKHLISDLQFNKYVSIYILPSVHHYIPITKMIDIKDMGAYKNGKAIWDKLPEDKRTIFILRDIDKLSNLDELKDINHLDI